MAGTTSETRGAAMKDRILKKIEGYEACAIELQKGLTAIPAISPSSGGDGEYEGQQTSAGAQRQVALEGGLAEPVAAVGPPPVVDDHREVRVQDQAEGRAHRNLNWSP